MAQNTQTFTLVGDFKDNITPALKKLTRNLKTFEKSFSKSFAKPMASISKDWARLEKDMTKGMNSFDRKFQQATKKMARNSKKDFKAIGDSFEDAVFSDKSLKRSLARFDKYQREVQRRAGRSIKGGEILYDSFATEAGRDRGRGGRGGRGGVGAPQQRQFFDAAIGDGFSIEKGVVAGLAVEGVTRIMDMLVSSVGGAINYLKGAVQERVQDEMSDIKSAGGIFSVGKEKKIAFADTYDEAMGLQKKLNAEMANLAAALPGTTNDYVRNMKMVTDTSMKAVASNSQGMIKQLNELKKIGVVAQDTVIKTTQDAFVETTKQMAKFSTLAEQGQSGGMPFTSLMEQMITSDKVSVKSLKSRYAALRYDPLISGAIESYEAELNKFGAGSAERVATMLKALNKAFPPEVIAAMEKSADGIYQAMKSYLFDPDVGWFGLGRLMEIDFSEFKGNKMGKLKETMGLFDMFVKMFGAFGMILGPILKELPKIMEVFSSVIDPFKEFYVNAENTISNFNKAKKDFAKAKKSFPEFRASLSAIGKLAKSFGGDAGEIQKLDKMLSADKLDLGGALQQATKTLFSSEAMERFGRAIGQALGGFLSMLAGLAETGKGLVDESGLMKGFADGWKGAKGSEAVAKLVKDLLGFVAKSLWGLTVEAFKTDPIGVGLVLTIFVSPIRNAVINFLKMVAGRVTGALGAKEALTKGGAKITGDVAKGGAGQAVKGFLASQVGKTAKAGAAIPGVASVGKGAAALASGAKMKGVSTLAAGMITLSTKTKGLEKAGTAITNIGKRIPLLSIALGGLDFAARKAAGQDTAKAAGGAAGSVAGGLVGAAIGQAAIPIPVVGAAIGGVIGSALGDWIGSNIVPAFKAIPGMLSSAWSGLKTWLYNLPGQIVSAIAYAQGYMEGSWARFSSWFMGLGPKFMAWLSNALATLNTAWTRFMWQIRALFTNPGKYLAGAKESLGNAISNAVRGAFDWAKRQLANFGSWITQQKQNYARTRAEGRTAAVGAAKGSPGVHFGSLGQAINYEMANKPSGSDLVIANSSETIIPEKAGKVGSAAGGSGEGLTALVNAIFSTAAATRSALARGFTDLTRTTLIGDAKIAATTQQSGAKTTSAVHRQIATQIAGDAKIMGAIKAASAAGGFGGGMGGALGGASGNLQSAAGLAKSMGLTMTSYKRSGPPGASYHNVGRAMDFSNSTGPTPQMMQFAQSMAARYGSSMAELIYTPLGYGIKNGKKVAPYAAAAHYNHVHVAFAKGPGNPTMFSSKGAAIAYEKFMAPAGAKVGSVTSNSSELGGTTNLTQNITIDGYGGNPEQLAATVWDYTQKAIGRMQSNSFA